MRKNNSKLNNGCLNIFKFLEYLYNNSADYETVYNLFKNDILQGNEVYDDKKLNNLVQVVLNKYINALRIFGVKIKKEKHKFILESSLYSIPCSDNDIKALSILSEASSKLPDSSINKNISDLLSNIMLRLDNQSRSALNAAIGNYDFSFYFTNIKDQIEQCRKYCNDSVILEIAYINKRKEEKCKCQPKDIRYTTKTAFLCGYDILKKENIEIAIPNIISIGVNPRRTTPYDNVTTIVFKLKGRLAKTYQLKTNEKLDSKTEDTMVIINTGEPRDKLFARLMRYADLCEIISPKYIRDDMEDMINEALNNYEND
ncbi:hypothetical protein J6N69_02485 [bacterium]|nr:hypothetical protein [bacterium]